MAVSASTSSDSAASTCLATYGCDLSLLVRGSDGPCRYVRGRWGCNGPYCYVRSRHGVHVRVGLSLFSLHGLRLLVADAISASAAAADTVSASSAVAPVSTSAADAACAFRRPVPVRGRACRAGAGGRARRRPGHHRRRPRGAPSVLQGASNRADEGQRRHERLRCASHMAVVTPQGGVSRVALRPPPPPPEAVGPCARRRDLLPPPAGGGRPRERRHRAPLP